jgi:hypothetical protein
MNNKVEILRAICFTKEDIANITNLEDSFSEKEIEFMVEFKKIYELGTTQLERFIDKLDDEGTELDTYSITYYISLLLNGPLGTHTREYSKDKKYFVNTPEIMGMLGNNTSASQNTTIFEDGKYPLGCSVDSYNKLPKFMQMTLGSAVKITEDVFRSSLKSSSEIDNTLPIADKSNQLRYQEEGTGIFVKRSNGSYMVKDSAFSAATLLASKDIYSKVENYLGDENFRVYKDKKQFSPFDSEKNNSLATNKIVKDFYDGDNKREIVLDLMGDEFDSVDKRTSKLKIIGIEKDKEYVLNTTVGQLGA